MFAEIFIKPLKFLSFAGIWIDRKDVLFFIALLATAIIVIMKKNRIENLLEEAMLMEEAFMKGFGGKKLRKQINGVNRIFLSTIGIFSIFASFRSGAFIPMREQSLQYPQ
jgi:hypothetical protein